MKDPELLQFARLAAQIAENSPQSIDPSKISCILTLLNLSTSARGIDQRKLISMLVQCLTALLDLRSQFDLQQQQRTAEREFEQRLLREKMDEAQHLAAELHDGVGQELVGISMMLSALSRTPDAENAAIKGPLGSAGGLLVQAISNCRSLSEGFGAFLVRRNGVTAALRHLIHQLDSSTTRISFDGDDLPAQCLSDTAAYYLFGIGREAIRNACRHAQATNIHVICCTMANQITLAVQDDGIGLSQTSRDQGGIGRSIMEYRARSIGAELEFSPASTGGLHVRCTLPVPLTAAS